MSKPKPKKPPEEKLVQCFREVLKHLKKGIYWNHFGRSFSEAYPNIDGIFEEKIRDLQRIDCAVVVIGATSAGKSTLINKIIGEKILVRDPLETTTKIYRIKHSATFQLKTYQRNAGTPTVQVFESSESLHKQLVKLESKAERDPSIHQVDVLIPFARLKGNITIVDTPGIGDSEDLKKLLHEYIPKAVAFVFVVDVSGAGGLQTDRLVQILNDIESRTEHDDMQCFDPRDVLFLRNKWDCIEASDERKEEMKSELSEKIKDIWRCTKDENIFDVILREMQKETDSVVYKILRNLTERLCEYIHSEEFVNDVLQAEPALSSFMKIRIDHEIGKRIEKATELWIAKSTEEAVKRHILEKAEEFLEELRHIERRLGGISNTFTEQSTTVNGIMWTLVTGTGYVFNKFLWRAVAGPQVATVLTGFAVLVYVSEGINETIKLTYDKNVVIQMSFKNRIESLSPGNVRDVIKKRCERHLRKVYINIYSKLLPNALKQYEETMNVLQKNRAELEKRHAELDSFAKDLEKCRHDLKSLMDPSEGHT